MCSLLLHSTLKLGSVVLTTLPCVTPRSLPVLLYKSALFLIATMLGSTFVLHVFSPPPLNAQLKIIRGPRVHPKVPLA